MADGLMSAIVARKSNAESMRAVVEILCVVFKAAQKGRTHPA
jgi:hypothetical protein